jgi:hypothetical protein
MSMFLNLNIHQNLLEAVKQKLQGPRVSNSIGLEWDLRVCFPSKVPDGNGAAGAVTTF